MDYFSNDNPIWTRIGTFVPVTDSDSEQRLQLRMSFQTRKSVADELLRRLGLVSES